MAPSPKTQAVCLLGPTAAGKTDVAVELVRRYPFEVISVDSAMVYRYMNIGTAKPTPQLLREVPHALIDIRDPWETYSAGAFCADAEPLIKEIAAAGKIPLLVGGTLLYFRALQEGLAPLPPADASIRTELDKRGDTEGWSVLHQELAAIDPAAARRIGPADRQRIQRALEVYQITGEPITVLQQMRGKSAETKFFRLAIVPGDRALLHARIEQRFAEMIAQGFIEEVRGLQAMPQMSASSPAMRAVGYRQLWEHLQGDTDRVEAERRGVVATRRYAKRQLTWLRSESCDQQLNGFGRDVVGDACRAIEASGCLDAL